MVSTVHWRQEYKLSRSRPLPFNNFPEVAPGSLAGNHCISKWLQQEKKATALSKQRWLLQQPALHGPESSIPQKKTFQQHTRPLKGNIWFRRGCRNRDGATTHNKALCGQFTQKWLPGYMMGGPYNRDNGRMSEIKPVNNGAGINATSTWTRSDRHSFSDKAIQRWHGSIMCHRDVHWLSCVMANLYCQPDRTCNHHGNKSLGVSARYFLD